MGACGTTSWDEGWMIGWSNTFDSACFQGRGLIIFIFASCISASARRQMGVRTIVQGRGFMFRGIGISMAPFLSFTYRNFLLPPNP